MNEYRVACSSWLTVMQLLIVVMIPFVCFLTLTVDHKTVMCKLYKCGVRGVILNLLSDYLTNGKQDVTVADTI